MPLVPPARTRKRVTLVDQRDEPCRIDVGIDLRGRDVGMAEKRLQHAQVRPALQEMSRECVAQNVRDASRY